MESKRISLPFHTKPCPSGSGCVEINSASMMRGNSCQKVARVAWFSHGSTNNIKNQNGHWGMLATCAHLLSKTSTTTNFCSIEEILQGNQCEQILHLNLQTSPAQLFDELANEQQSGHRVAQAAPCYQSKPCRDQSRPEKKGLLAHPETNAWLMTIPLPTHVKHDSHDIIFIYIYIVAWLLLVSFFSWMPQ